MSFCKTISAAFAAACIILSCGGAFAQSDEINQIAQAHPLASLAAGETNSDWYAYALGKANIQDNFEDYLKRLEAYVSEKYSTSGGLDKHKITEWHRIALTVNALGGDPTSFAGVNLIKDGVTEPVIPPERQGVNGLIWAVITAHECNDAVGDFSARELCNKIILKQNADGGFSVSGKSDPDVTAMAIMALWNEEGFCSYGELARAALINMRLPNGEFASYGTENCESSAQAAQAFAYIGDRENALAALETVKTYKTAGGYSHIHGKDANEMATWQAMLAFIACDGFLNEPTKEIKEPVIENTSPEENNSEQAEAVSAEVTLAMPQSEEAFPIDNEEAAESAEEQNAAPEKSEKDDAKDNEAREEPVKREESKEHEEKEESKSQAAMTIVVACSAALVIAAYTVAERKRRKK